MSHKTPKPGSSHQGFSMGNAVNLGIALLTALGMNEAIKEYTNNPWLALVLSLVVAVGVFVLARVTNLANWVGEKFDAWLQGIFTGAGYKKKYLQHLVYRNRNFDVKGLTTQGTYTLELAKVFVELSIVPRPAHETSKNLIQLPDELQAGRHTIWEFLQAREGQDFAIIGAPGSGKTTLLKHITLALALPKSRKERQKLPERLPVLLALRDQAKAIEEEKDDAPYTLTEAMERDLRKWEMEAPEGWFKERLEAGGCLVMLDGLDEVADPALRSKVVSWVERQMKRYDNNQFVVTSRPHGYHSNPLAGVTVLEVRPFDSEQQKQFIENWYLANEIQSQGKDDEGVRQDARVGAK